MHIVITGAHGYIGRAVLAKARDAGHELTLLSSGGSPAAGAGVVLWRLGQPVPQAVWADPVDAVIHLAHVWHDTAAEADDPNIAGTAMLANAARRAGVKRFVFASSISARPDARNRYGRIKWRIEQTLDRPGEVSARIGLVYGGPAQSLWGLLRRLTQRLPLLPMIGGGQRVQPIHLSDVADGLVRLAATPGTARHVVLATDPPVTFGRFLEEIAARVHGRRLLLVPVPQWPILTLLDLMVRIGLPVVGLRERVLGLVGITVQPASADLDAIGLKPLALEQGLALEGARDGHDVGAEAAALLRYVRGKPPSSGTLRRYLRGWKRINLGAPVLPALVRRCPSLLRLCEPFPANSRPRAVAFRARLSAAAMLSEAEPAYDGQFYAYRPAGAPAAWSAMIWNGAVEALLLLPRLMLSRWMWR